VQIDEQTDLRIVKQRYGVPSRLQGCHTAVVEGYIIEGHVPAEVIERLIRERPQVAGLAVPGMPVGSPGMEIAGQPAQPYQVIAFDNHGHTYVFATR
jgi:hypothetical protein